MYEGTPITLHDTLDDTMPWTPERHECLHWRWTQCPFNVLQLNTGGMLKIALLHHTTTVGQPHHSRNSTTVLLLIISVVMTSVVSALPLPLRLGRGSCTHRTQGSALLSASWCSRITRSALSFAAEQKKRGNSSDIPVIGTISNRNIDNNNNNSIVLDNSSIMNNKAEHRK